MKVPLEITCRNMEKDERLDELIREKASRLDRFHGSLLSCRVVLEQPNRHQRSGAGYRVRILLRVPPGHDTVIKQDPDQGDLHQNLPDIVRENFKSATRYLRDLMDKQKGVVKKHAAQEITAVISKLFPEEGYGFLRNTNDDEIYFHRDSVSRKDFDRLEIGTGVRHTETMGDKGPQSSTVHIVDKPGARIGKS